MAQKRSQKTGRTKAPQGRPARYTYRFWRESLKNIAGGMNGILADVFALYMKTKNFHWHMSGPHFRDYHLLLDEQADQLYAMTDPIAERIRKTGGSTLRSIGHIARIQRIKDNDAEYVDPLDMLAELREDNQTLAARLREVHEVVDEMRDIATASLIENWIDETERRTWFLFEASRRGDITGHEERVHYVRDAGRIFPKGIVTEAVEYLDLRIRQGVAQALAHRRLPEDPRFPR